MIGILLLAYFVVSSTSAQCIYQKGDLTVRWSTTADQLFVEFTNKNLTNNQWTGIGWGDTMRDLEVVVFELQNNSPSYLKGYTNGYAPPTQDANASVNVNTITYQGTTFTARFTRSMRANGTRYKNLSSCSPWKFVLGGNIVNGQLQIHNRGKDGMTVCPNQCSGRLF